MLRPRLLLHPRLKLLRRLKLHRRLKPHRRPKLLRLLKPHRRLKLHRRQLAQASKLHSRGARVGALLQRALQRTIAQPGIIVRLASGEQKKSHERPFVAFLLWDALAW